MPGIRQMQRESAMELISQVAVQMIARGGYDAMTLANVGQLAGYSRGLATHHFGSKAGLLESVLGTILAKNAEVFRSVTEGKVGRERFAAIIDSALSRCVEAPDQARAYLMLTLEPTATWAAARLIDQTIRFREAAEDAARDAIARGEISSDWHPADVASIASAMARGYAYEWAADPQTDLMVARRRVATFVASLGNNAMPPKRTSTAVDTRRGSRTRDSKKAAADDPSG